MALRGDLASVDLAQVFQMLALNKKVGLLSIHSAKSWQVLYFDHRGVTLYHNVHTILDRVVQALVRTGRLVEESVEEVRDHAARQRQAVTDTLLAGGYVSAEELDQQYGLELEEEIYELFFCREARFEFHEGVTSLEGRPGAIDERFFFNCDSVIMEAARRIDEWAYISERVPTTAEVFVPTVDAADLTEFGAEAPAVFAKLDGRHTVTRIVARTGQANFQVCKVLSQMLDAGLIAPIDPDQLIPTAQACHAEGKVQQAIDLYERAIDLGIGLPAVHSLVAKAYQAARQYENAVRHLELEAEHLVAAGDTLGGARQYLVVRQLVPTHLRARERLVELALLHKAAALDGFDAIAEGKEVVDLLVEFGDVARVRQMLERLLAVAPGDLDLKKALVNVHVKAGDQKRVAELYESIADDLVRLHRPLEAVGYLQKILLLDRSRSDVSERMRKLYEFDERSRKRRRSLASLASMFVLTVALGVAYWFYDRRAADVFATLDVEAQLAAQDYVGAANVYEVFCATHPLTTSVAAAQSKLRDIEVLRQRREAELTAVRVEREREQAALRAAYKVAYARHREEFLAGRPEASLEALAEVRALVAKAGDSADMAWALEQQVERMWQRLQEFLGNADELAKAYEAALLAGDWRLARDTALRLRGEFESTRAARSCQIPVFVTTRPAGAVLLQNGEPLRRREGDAMVTVRTPAMVLGPADGNAVRMRAELAGFAPLDFEFAPLANGQVELRLEVVADRVVDFQKAVQTGVAMGGGWLAAGLRGGYLGVARADGTGVAVHQLEGLRSVDAMPAIAGDRVFYLTTDNTLECLLLDGLQPVPGWPARLPAAPATELVAQDGRVLVVDRDHVLHCFEQASARKLWAVPLGSAAAGAPTLDSRTVLVGTGDGRVLRLEADNGAVVSTFQAPAGVVTRVAIGADGSVVFGLANGSLQCLGQDGKVLWTAPLDRVAGDAEFACTAAAVFAVGADGQLFGLDPRTGAKRTTVALGAGQVLGIQARGQRAFVKVRRPRQERVPSTDSLLACDVAVDTVLWEYTDPATVVGGPTCDDQRVAWPGAARGVILFR